MNRSLRFGAALAVCALSLAVLAGCASPKPAPPPVSTGGKPAVDPIAEGKGAK